MPSSPPRNLILAAVIFGRVSRRRVGVSMRNPLAGPTASHPTSAGGGRSAVFEVLRRVASGGRARFKFSSQGILSAADEGEG